MQELVTMTQQQVTMTQQQVIMMQQQVVVIKKKWLWQKIWMSCFAEIVKKSIHQYTKNIYRCNRIDSQTQMPEIYYIRVIVTLKLWRWDCRSAIILGFHDVWWDLSTIF